MVLVSALGHAVLLDAPAIRARIEARREPAPPLLERAGYAARVAPPAMRATVAMDRLALVTNARAARRAGRLALGEFLLDANAIDAREQGAAFDRAEVGALYAARLDALRLAAAKAPLRAAVPEVFGDLHYYGRPGGRVGDALIEGGGSCEPLAQLLAAALFDTGHAARAGLRYYGGAGVIPHLTPVLRDGKAEIDLLSGRAALRGGARFAADELVEIYARAHDLAPREGAAADAREGASGDGAGGDGARGEASAAPPASMADGYPPNRDRYPGATPLYAGRAVLEEGALTAAEEGKMLPSDQVADCAFFVRLAVLDPPAITLGEDAAGAAVEIVRVPSSEEIDRVFSRIAAVESMLAPPAPLRVEAVPLSAPASADRLMELACLTALYERAAVDLTLTRAPAIAGASLAKRNERAAAGAALLASIDWSSPVGEAVARRLTERFSGRSWLLLVLDGGDVPALLSLADRDDWGRVNVLAGLLIASSTRARALALTEKLPRRQQIEVMHEVFHAHDNLRPWSSNYALDLDASRAGEGEFPRAYRVFRGVAWGLWEGARAPEEVLSALRRDVAKEHLDPSWEVALLGYFAQNALNLHRFRADNAAFSRALARWLRDNGHSDLEIYRRLVSEGGPD